MMLKEQSFVLSCREVCAIADLGKVSSDFERVAYNYHLGSCALCFEYVCEVEATVPMRYYPPMAKYARRAPVPANPVEVAPVLPEPELLAEPLAKTVPEPVIAPRNFWSSWRWSGTLWGWNRGLVSAVALAVLFLGGFWAWRSWSKPARDESIATVRNPVTPAVLEPTPDAAQSQPTQPPVVGPVKPAPAVIVPAATPKPGTQGGPAQPQTRLPARPATSNAGAGTAANRATELLAANLPKPEILKELATIAGQVRGAPPAATARVIGPQGAVFVDSRPIFRWTPVPGATSYAITVGDINQYPVLESGPLSGDITTWQAPRPLPGGAYSWSLVAQVGEKEVVLPALEQPEAKFGLLNDKQRSALTQLLRQARPSLPLAVFYAQAGMVAEARGELRSYLRRHPQNVAARQLQQRIRRW